MEQRGQKLARRALEIWPSLVVDKALINAAQQAEMRALAARRDVGKVPMSSKAKEIFEILRERVLSIDNDIVELAEQKSVTYHGPEFS